jgi:hypothetical protein
MDELTMIAELLPATEPPSAATVEAAYGRLAALTAAAGATGRLASRRTGCRTPHRRTTTAAWLACTSAVAATAAAIAVFAASSNPGAGPAVSYGKAGSARAVLLAAADRITRGQAAGTYWAVRSFDDELFPAGTKAHPYDVFLRRRADIWLPSAASGRDVSISQELTARLATTADAVAWRAAGSPSRWVMPNGWPGTWSLTRPVPGSTFTNSGTGQRGCDLGDGHVSEIALTTAQCLRLPDTRAGLRAVLIPYAEQYVRGTKLGSTGLTLDEWIANGAYQVLTDPVRPQTDAAALRLLANYPGMRLIAKVRDPLGRTGYALALQVHGRTSTEFIISPTTGQLLATARVYSSRAQWLRQSWYYIGKTYHAGFYGRAWYPGMVAEWTIIRQMGWTNVAPRA